MWKCYGTGDPEELQSDVNLQYFLLVTGRTLNLALNKIAYECVKQNSACGKSTTGEENQGDIQGGSIYSVTSNMRELQISSLLMLMDRCVSRWTQPSTSLFASLGSHFQEYCVRSTVLKAAVPTVFHMNVKYEKFSPSTVYDGYTPVMNWEFFSLSLGNMFVHSH